VVLHMVDEFLKAFFGGQRPPRSEPRFAAIIESVTNAPSEMPPGKPRFGGDG